VLLPLPAAVGVVGGDHVDHVAAQLLRWAAGAVRPRVGEGGGGSVDLKWEAGCVWRALRGGSNCFRARGGKSEAVAGGR
jgi:hypothetical protein